MEPQIKGYSVLASGRFILEDRPLRGRIPPDVLDAIIAQQARVKPGEWYALTEALLSWRAIVAVSDGEAEARDNLVRCGEFNANAATGSFLKFLLKVLTPSMFAKKFPDFWAHDFKGGRIDVDKLGEKGLVFGIRDVEGFDHVAMIAMGYISFALRATGLKNLVARCPSWSLATPGPRDIVLEITWD